MKKAVVSSIIIGSFLIYGLFKGKGTGAPQPVVTPDAPIPSNVPSTQSNTIYKDGTYIGSAADAFYGYIQVKATVNSGKIADVVFLQYPDSHQRSVVINTYAMPILKQKAISAQSASVDIVSGATDTSQAFVESLTNALAKAQ